MTKAQFKYLSSRGQVVVFKEGSNFTEYGRANLGKVWLLIEGDVRITVEKELRNKKKERRFGPKIPRNY